MTEKSITLALTEFPDYGSLLTREEFDSFVQAELFIDYDGYGYLATEEGYVQLLKVLPSEWYYFKMYAPEELTHVLWFNR